MVSQTVFMWKHVDSLTTFAIGCVMEWIHACPFSVPFGVHTASSQLQGNCCTELKCLLTPWPWIVVDYLLPS